MKKNFKSFSETLVSVLIIFLLVFLLVSQSAFATDQVNTEDQTQETEAMTQTDSQQSQEEMQPQSVEPESDDQQSPAVNPAAESDEPDPEPEPEVIAAPEAVTNFTCTLNSYRSLNLTWNSVAGAVGYQIYRYDKSYGGYKYIKHVEATTDETMSFLNGGLTLNKYYYYKIKAYNYDAEGKIQYSPLSQKVYGRPVMSPVKVTISKSPLGNRLTWTSARGAEGYRIYRRTASGSYRFIFGTNGTAYTDASAKPNYGYYYMVRAYRTIDGVRQYDKDWKAVFVKTCSYKTVFIACGHGTTTTGYWDPGCVYRGYTEARLMLSITKSMVKYLRKSGVRVYTDADRNNNINMISCVSWANTLQLNAYVSLHCDYSLAPSGTLPFYSSSGGYSLARSLNAAVTSGMKMRTRGVSKRSSLYECRAPRAVACLFETGSISKDLYKLKRYDSYGKYLAKGMCNYLGIKFVA